MKENAENAKPLFYEQARKTYMENTDADIDAFNAALSAKKDELSEYSKRADAYNNQYQMAQKRYSDNRDFDYNKYSDNREFWAQQYHNEQQQANYNKEYQLKEYETYSKLASVKCAEYNDKKNNKGMRSYLDGLVKNGKLTKYMADNLYNQYKYTAPKSSGGRVSTKKSNKDETSNVFDYLNISDSILYSSVTETAKNAGGDPKEIMTYERFENAKAKKGVSGRPTEEQRKMLNEDYQIAAMFDNYQQYLNYVAAYYQQ